MLETGSVAAEGAMAMSLRFGRPTGDGYSAPMPSDEDKPPDEAALNLVVLRCVEVERAARFYRALGVSFVREQHGNGPEHLSGRAGTVLLELYPRDPTNPVDGTRLGFSVGSLNASIAATTAAGGSTVSPPRDGAWGRRAVVAAPDGRRVELVRRGAL